MRLVHVLSVGAALALGYGAAFLVHGSGSAVSSGRETGYKAKEAIADKGDDASVRALRARVRELERQLAERFPGEEVVMPPEQAPKGADAQPQESWPERMARLEKEDPARYASITNHMTQWRLRQAERRQARLEYFAGVNTSRMGENAKQIHADLMEALSQQDELERQLHDPETSNERRQELWGQLRELNETTRQLNNRERGNLIAETAKALGFKGEDVKNITSTLRDIIDATDNGWGGPHGGRRGHRGPGGRR